MVLGLDSSTNHFIPIQVSSKPATLAQRYFLRLVSVLGILLPRTAQSSSLSVGAFCMPKIGSGGKRRLQVLEENREAKAAAHGVWRLLSQPKTTSFPASSREAPKSFSPCLAAGQGDSDIQGQRGIPTVLEPQRQQTWGSRPRAQNLAPPRPRSSPFIPRVPGSQSGSRSPTALAHGFLSARTPANLYCF